MKPCHHPLNPLLRSWKALALLLLLLLLAESTRAQVPDWQQAMALNTAAGSSSQVTTTALDASGSVYVAGSFQGTVGFGSTTLNSAATSAGFVAKWNPMTSTWVWAYPLPSAQSAYVTALVVEGFSVYVGGLFINSVTLGGTTLSGAGSYRGFVAKLTDGGAAASFAWATAIGGAAYDYVLGLAAQGGSLYVVGALHSPLVSFGTATVANAGYSTGYVAKMLDAGSSARFAWVQAVDSPGQSRLNAVAVVGADVYVAGSFAGVATCGSTTLASSNANDVDALVAKLTDAGATAGFTWARQAGSSGPDQAVALVAAGADVYVAGEVGGSATFGSTLLAGLGRTDAFAAKLTDAGAGTRFAWAQLAGGAGFDGVKALAQQGSSLYLSGYTTSAQARFGAATLAGLGDYDAFVARVLDGGGSSSFAWARPAGGPGSDQANALAVRGAQLWVGGYAAGVARFGAHPISSAGADTFGFLASIEDAAALAVAPPAARAAEISIYPNPARAAATVVVPAGLLASPVTLAVLDALGRTLRTQTAAASANAELDLTGLAPGLYAVRATAGTATATRRLVVE